MQVGLMPTEIQQLLASKLAEKTLEFDRSTPLRSGDIHVWVERLLGHYSQVWIAVLTDVIDKNNQRIAQQLSEQR
jgi:hypothetical protein